MGASCVRIGRRASLPILTPSLAAQTPLLEKHSTYKEAELQACVHDIHKLHSNATGDKLQAVRKKYKHERHGNVSSITPAWGPLRPKIVYHVSSWS